jgi:hypothetical protein
VVGDPIIHGFDADRHDPAPAVAPGATWKGPTGGKPRSRRHIGGLHRWHPSDEPRDEHALLEGAAFFAGTAYMTERQLFILGVIAGSLVIMAASFPTRRRIEDWLENRLARINEMRQFGDSSSE